MRLAYLVVGCFPVLGQTSHVSSVTKAPGEKVTLDILAYSQPARAPVALKWEVVFPAQLMEMDGDAPEIGKAATDSGKSLQCTARKPYRYVCILSGGQNPIADGSIAIFHFGARTSAEARTTTLRIESAESTTVDSKKWTLNNTEAIVLIRDDCGTDGHSEVPEMTSLAKLGFTGRRTNHVECNSQRSGPAAILRKLF
jgi:hypothetical protein